MYKPTSLIVDSSRVEAANLAEISRFQNMRNLHVWHTGSPSIFVGFCSGKKQCLSQSVYFKISTGNFWPRKIIKKPLWELLVYLYTVEQNFHLWRNLWNNKTQPITHAVLILLAVLRWYRLQRYSTVKLNQPISNIQFRFRTCIVHHHGIQDVLFTWFHKCCEMLVQNELLECSRRFWLKERFENNNLRKPE